MIARFVEVTDQDAYGKILVARFDAEELEYRSSMPEAQGARMLNYGGSRRMNTHATMVWDLQRGTGAAWPLSHGESGMRDYYMQHLRGLVGLVCWMYLPFVRWLHEQGEFAMGAGDITIIPAYVELPHPLNVAPAWAA